MQLLLDQFGIQFQFVEAVDARQIDPADYGSWLNAHPEWPFRIGSFACLSSHLAVWRMIRDGTDAFGLILEDDLHFAPDLASLVVDPSWIPGDAEVVKFETLLSYGTRVDRRSIAAQSGYRLHRLRGRHLGAGAYLVSRDTAAALLSGTVDRSVDCILFDEVEGRLRSLSVYQLVPAPCIQGSSLTDYGGASPEPVFQSTIRSTPTNGRTVRRPRPRYTEPYRASHFLTKRLGMPAAFQRFEGHLRYLAFRLVWTFRGQRMGPIAFRGQPIGPGGRRRS